MRIRIISVIFSGSGGLELAHVEIQYFKERIKNGHQVWGSSVDTCIYKYRKEQKEKLNTVENTIRLFFNAILYSIIFR